MNKEDWWCEKGMGGRGGRDDYSGQDKSGGGLRWKRRRSGTRGVGLWDGGLEECVQGKEVVVL